MSEITVKEVKTAVDSLRESVEKYGVESAEAKQMSDKVNATLEASEKKNVEIVAGMAAADKKALDLEERVKDFEAEVARLGKNAQNPANYKEGAEYKALNLFAKKGFDGMSVEEVKAMRMDDGTAGGYLTSTEMDTQIIKSMTEISPVRQVSRVKTISKKTLEIPKRTSIPVATYEGEAAAGPESQSAYGSEQLTAYRQTVTVPFTMDLLGDSNFDLETEINADVAEAFAFGEGNKFVLGTGAKQPEGFLVNAAIVAAAVDTAGSGTISGDDLLLMTGRLKAGYNPLFAFNRQTLAFLRTLKGSDGQYLWQMGLSPNAPNTIGGDPYMVMQDMPIIATGALSVVYGDFLRGYCITDRTGMVMIRDDLTQKKSAIVELTFHRWNTGQVVLSEAFTALSIKS